MKREFIGFYNPTKEETEISWSQGVFCFDANSILNLYRYSESTRNDFINALKSIQDRLFIPYQAAFEFHKNRLGVISGTKSAYKDLDDFYKKCFKENIEPQLNRFKKHPALNLISLEQLNNEFLSKISKELEKQQTTHPNFESDDSLLYSINDLFQNNIGKDFQKSELKKIYEEGKERYAEKIPPGYMDLEGKKSKGERNIYGDLIIWKELIEYTKKEKKPIIFVTDDRKEDWWTIEKGATIRPREELIKEFYDLTGIRILIYSADSFLHFAKERNLLPEIKDKTLEEIKNIRVSDEKTNSNITKYRLPSPSNRTFIRPKEKRMSPSNSISQDIHDEIAKQIQELFSKSKQI